MIDQAEITTKEKLERSVRFWMYSGPVFVVFALVMISLCYWYYSAIIPAICFSWLAASVVRKAYTIRMQNKVVLAAFKNGWTRTVETFELSKALKLAEENGLVPVCLGGEARVDSQFGITSTTTLCFPDKKQYVKFALSW